MDVIDFWPCYIDGRRGAWRSTLPPMRAQIQPNGLYYIHTTTVLYNIYSSLYDCKYDVLHRIITNMIKARCFRIRNYVSSFVNEMKTGDNEYVFKFT